MEHTSISLRWARVSDAEAIAAYHHACRIEAFTPLVSAEVVSYFEPFTERWNEWLALDSEFTTVVVTNDFDEAIGHTTVRANKLAHLFVAPAYQGDGIGRQLLAIGERLIRQGGHRHGELQTRVGNDRAIALYQSRGWELTDEIVQDPLQNGDTVSEHVLRKDFGAATDVEADEQDWDPSLRLG